MKALDTYSNIYTEIIDNNDFEVFNLKETLNPYKSSAESCIIVCSIPF